jgi:nucleoid DNA-binding protein
LSRAKIIKQLKQINPKLNQSSLEAVLDSFCNDITSALKSGRKIELRDFGTFFVTKLKEKHSARNPKTGKLIYVPEKNKVRFKASKKLKKKINE